LSTLTYALARLSAVKAAVEHLKESEFPYSHPKEALELLEHLFSHQQTVLEKVSPTAPASVIHNACSTSLYQLFVYVPILGFILRSTNVRNAFEWYSPLLRLARTVLKADTKLIISSEWDYSPFVYQAMMGLPGFVLIGLPAPESSNPLLIPLAGHELGHSVWEAEGLAATFEVPIEKGVLNELSTTRWSDYHLLYPQYKQTDLTAGDMFIHSTWSAAFTWSQLQAEEMFCDFFGLRLFAECYLHAFSYILAPGTSGQRSLNYPNIARRIAHLIHAAKLMGVSVPVGFDIGFEAETEPVDPATKLLVSIADKVSESLLPDLIKAASEIAGAKKVPVRDAVRVSQICDEFRRVIPTAKAQTLTDILNAGWQSELVPDLWKSLPQIRPEDKHRILRDLVLKSMEVSEVMARLGTTP
jgi:hypothetical protein